MISEALTFLADEMNEHFKQRLKIKEDKVLLSAIVNQDGTMAVKGENKVLMTLVNIEKENTKSINNITSNVTGGIVKPDLLHLNLYILFSAYFSSGNYEESLRFLSYIIGFFQYKNVFNRVDTPALDDRIDKLIFEMTAVSTEQLNNIWACMGAKYMPSVIYKMRMLSFDESVVREYRPSVSGMEINED